MVRTLRYSSVLKKKLIDNEKHQFSQNHALRLYNSNSIYTFIPKNACSTMRLSLAFANGCVDDIADFEWIHLNNATFQSDLASLSRATYTFVILRCPYSRLVSVYLDKIVGHESLANKLYSLIHREVPNKKVSILKKLYYRKSKSFISSLSFYNFVKYLKEERIKVADKHWRPQVDFLVYKDYDDWFCIENFPEAATTLKQKIDLDIVDARKLTLHGVSHLEKVNNKEFPNMAASTIRQLKATGSSPTPYSLYNDELIDMVNAMYAEDIALYKAQFGTRHLMFP